MRLFCRNDILRDKLTSCIGCRGVSIIFSSGDGGVGDGNPDPSSQQCFTNDGQNQHKFIPIFPASCPLCVSSCYLFFIVITAYMNSVTTVGGTKGIPEVASEFSGGGFSNYVGSFIIEFALPTILK